MDSPNDSKRWTTPSALPSPLRRTLDDRSLSSRQAGKNYHRKSRARNGTTEYAPGATRGLPLRPIDTIPCASSVWQPPATFLPVISPRPFSYFYYPLAFSSLLYPSFLSSRTDIFPLPAPPLQRENERTQGVDIKRTAARDRIPSVWKRKKKEKKKKIEEREMTLFIAIRHIDVANDRFTGDIETVSFSAWPRSGTPRAARVRSLPTLHYAFLLPHVPRKACNLTSNCSPF